MYVYCTCSYNLHVKKGMLLTFYVIFLYDIKSIVQHMHKVHQLTWQISQHRISHHITAKNLQISCPEGFTLHKHQNNGNISSCECNTYLPARHMNAEI